MPRLIGVGFKRIPKFGILLGISFLTGDGEVGLVAATGASILSAPFINPIRMIEKQQRAYFKQTGATKPISDILKESAVSSGMTWLPPTSCCDASYRARLGNRHLPPSSCHFLVF